MDLKSYLRKHGISQREFGKRLGITQPAVNRYVTGRIPDKAMMQRIVELSGGEVTPSSWYPYEPEPADVNEVVLSFQGNANDGKTTITGTLRFKMEKVEKGQNGDQGSEVQEEKEE